MENDIKIIDITKLVSLKTNYQELVGDLLIFIMLIYNEINKKSMKYSNEGYAFQGSRMAYHRPANLEKEIDQTIADPEHNLFLIVRDTLTEELIGSITLLKHKQLETAELTNFYVAEKYRKRGIGSELFSKALDFAKEKNYKRVFLSSRRKGGFESSLRLYSKFGFKEIINSKEIGQLLCAKYQSPRTIPMIKHL